MRSQFTDLKFLSKEELYKHNIHIKLVGIWEKSREMLYYILISEIE